MAQLDGIGSRKPLLTILGLPLMALALGCRHGVQERNNAWGQDVGIAVIWKFHLCYPEQVPNVLGLNLVLGLDDQSLRPLAPQLYTLQLPLNLW